MTFKRRLTIVAVSCVFAIIALTASLVAIFANNNLLVKTNVSISYTAPDPPSIDQAYVSINTWRSGDAEKTEALALTNVNSVSTSPSVSNSLTETKSYMVIEFIVKNQSENTAFYFQERFAKTTLTNMKFEYYFSNQTQLEIDEILNQDITTMTEFYYNGTRFVNNVKVEPGQTYYIYAITSVDNLLQNANFSGKFYCHLSLTVFDDTPQLQTDGSTIEMGEMPQSYAGTDASLYTITANKYTECGVEYDVYTDEQGNKYAKKGEAYYRFEPIVWKIKGIYVRGTETSSSTKFTAFSATSVDKTKALSNVIITPSKILFSCAWNTDLVRVNYPNSTIYNYINEFYENVLNEYAGNIQTLSIYCNSPEGSTSTSMTDTNNITTSQKLWLFNTNQATGNFSATTRKIYATCWALGSDTQSLAQWWLRTNIYNTNNGGTYTANTVNAEGNFVASNINEVYGVLPAMVVNLP